MVAVSQARAKLPQTRHARGGKAPHRQRNRIRKHRTNAKDTRKRGFHGIESRSHLHRQIRHEYTQEIRHPDNAIKAQPSKLIRKLDIQTMPSKLNHRSSGSLEGVQTFAIYKPGKGRKSGGNQKSTRGSHDTQKQTFLRTTRDTRPSSPEDGSEHKPVRQLERREPRCRQEH
jgi:hypothetical protein